MNLQNSDTVNTSVASSKKYADKTIWVSVLLIVLVALALRLPGIGESGLWNDEAIVAAVAEHPFSELLGKVQRDAHPPLFFIIERFIRLGLGFDGWTEAAVRAVSLFFGITSILAIFLVGRQMISNRAGLLAAFLLAISPMHVHYSREGRNYTLLILLVILAISYVVSIHRKPTVLKGMLAAMIFVALVYTHSISFFVLMPIGIMLLFSLLSRREKESLATLGVTIGVSAAGILPWLPTLLSQSSQISNTSISGSGPIEWVKPYWVNLFPYQVPSSLAAMSHGSMPPINNFVSQTWVSAWFALGISAVLILLGWRRRTCWREPWSGYLLVVACLGPLFLLFIASWLGTPIYTVGRVDTIALPAFILLVASGVQSAESGPVRQPLMKLVAFSLHKVEFILRPDRFLRSLFVWLIPVIILAVLAIKPIQTETEAVRGNHNRSWIRYFSKYTTNGEVFVVTGKWWTTLEYYLPRFGKNLHLVGFPSGREDHPNWLDWSLYEGDALRKDAEAVARKATKIAEAENSMVWVYPKGAGVTELIDALSRHMMPVTPAEQPRVRNTVYPAFQPLILSHRIEQKDEEDLPVDELDPRSLRGQYETALDLQSRGKRKEAIPYFQRILNFNHEYKLAGFWLAFAYQRAGQSGEAVDTYYRFLEFNPNHVQGHFNLAYELMANSKYDAAVKHFNEVLLLRPNYRETHLHLSKIYVELGKVDLAAQHLQQWQGR